MSMDCEEIRVDMRKMSEEELAKGTRMMQQIFRLNHTMPMTPEYTDALKDLFGNRLGEGSHVAAPIAGAALDKVKIGRNVYVNTNALMMARGGITIEDDVQIAANVQLISNNHDEYDRQILTCRPVLIKEGAWIGAGATILPGVCVGKHAIVGAMSVVTKDVPDFAVVVGSPARVVKVLDPEGFREGGHKK